MHKRSSCRYGKTESLEKVVGAGIEEEEQLTHGRKLTERHLFLRVVHLVCMYPAMTFIPDERRSRTSTPTTASCLIKTSKIILEPIGFPEPFDMGLR